MTTDLRTTLDACLAASVAATDPVPGVVATVTDRAGVIYEGAAGVRRLGDPTPMSSDAILALFSCTKAITGTAVLQLVEEGLLDLDAPAADYLPEIGDLQVLDGIADDGSLKLRAPKRAITTRMLLLHTAGFGYDFFNATCRRLTSEFGYPSHRTGTRQSLKLPLLFDPGTDWEYGLSIDWAGLVAEAIRGKRLDAILSEHVFAPLGMTNTGFALSEAQQSRRAAMHAVDKTGALVPVPFEPPASPEVLMGGGGLFGTAGDYARFLRMWLNDGMGDHGRVLKPETVATASRNGLDGISVKPLPAINPALTYAVEFWPDIPKSWALTFLLNEADLPTGRPAGSLAWAGLANLYYWIDRKTGIAGFWGAQRFPFRHPTAIAGFEAFETAFYRQISAAR